MNRVDNLQQQNARLLGQVEQLQRDFQRLQDRQRIIYADLDKRITALGAKDDGDSLLTGKQPIVTDAATLASTQAAAAQNKATVTGTKTRQHNQKPSQTADSRELYEAAFNALRGGEHDAAIVKFDRYLQTYKNGRYADNAQYWKAEAFYVTRRFELAKEHFQALIDNYPASQKLADAYLKLGFTEYELKNYAQARRILAQTAREFANTQISKLAEQRLLRMNNENL